MGVLRGIAVMLVDDRLDLRPIEPGPLRGELVGREQIAVAQVPLILGEVGGVFEGVAAGEARPGRDLLEYTEPLILSHYYRFPHD